MSVLRLVKKFLLLLFFSWGSVMAQQVIETNAICYLELPMSEITVNDGLSQGMVSCFLKDGKGYLWIGTKDGLNRYDGYGFKVLRMSETDSNTLVGNYIVALYEDKEGMIWVGTMDNGITRYNPATGKFMSLSEAERINDQLGSKSIRRISGDGNGNICVGNSKGIDILKPEKKNFREYKVYCSAS